MNANDRHLAAEYALGVLDGQELAEARRQIDSDVEFRAEVADWSARLAPMLDEIEAVDAPPGLWRRIDAAIGTTERGAVNDNAATLRQRLMVWRSATAGMTALAAALAIILVGRPAQAPLPAPSQPAQTPPAAGPPMVAMVGDKAGTKLVANWDPAGKRLVLTVAGEMPADPGRAHELWVIPAGGSPRSLGTMPDDKAMHMDLADALAQLLGQGATIAISVEPKGGSPTGAPTGPVIASGTLESA